MTYLSYGCILTSASRCVRAAETLRALVMITGGLNVAIHTEALLHLSQQANALVSARGGKLCYF
jgi:hypothetical protein